MYLQQLCRFQRHKTCPSCATSRSVTTRGACWSTTCNGEKSSRMSRTSLCAQRNCAAGIRWMVDRCRRASGFRLGGTVRPCCPGPPSLNTEYLHQSLCAAANLLPQMTCICDSIYRAPRVPVGQAAHTCWVAHKVNHACCAAMGLLSSFSETFAALHSAVSLKTANRHSRHAF